MAYTLHLPLPLQKYFLIIFFFTCYDENTDGANLNLFTESRTCRFWKILCTASGCSAIELNLRYLKRKENFSFVYLTLCLTFSSGRKLLFFANAFESSYLSSFFGTPSNFDHYFSRWFYFNFQIRYHLPVPIAKLINVRYHNLEATYMHVHIKSPLNMKPCLQLYCGPSSNRFRETNYFDSHQWN